MIDRADLAHLLKEVNAAVMAVAESPSQVVEILKYIVSKQENLDS